MRLRKKRGWDRGEESNKLRRRKGERNAVHRGPSVEGARREKNGGNTRGNLEQPEKIKRLSNEYVLG